MHVFNAAPNGETYFLLTTHFTAIPQPDSMTMSQTTFLSDVTSGEPIPAGKLAYFQARLSNLLHEAVLSRFIKLEKERGFTRADLARRIGRKPEQVTRWFGSPGNWTLETISDLLIGMECELEPVLKDLARHADAHEVATTNTSTQIDAAWTTPVHPALFQISDGSVLIVFLEGGTEHVLSIPVSNGVQVFERGIATHPLSPTWLSQNNNANRLLSVRWTAAQMLNQANQSTPPRSLGSPAGPIKQNYLLGQRQ